MSAYWPTRTTGRPRFSDFYTGFRPILRKPEGSVQFVRPEPSSEIVSVCSDCVVVQGNYRGYPHAWVRFKDRIIDITATQFGDTCNPVRCVHVDDERYEAISEVKNHREWLLEIVNSQ